MIEQAENLLLGLAEDLGDLVDAEIFHRGEQEGLTGERRHFCEVERGALLPGIGRYRFGDGDDGGTKEVCVEFVQGDTIVGAAREDADIGDDRLEDGGDIGIAGGLAAGQRSRIAPQIGNVRRDSCRQSH